MQNKSAEIRRHIGPGATGSKRVPGKARRPQEKSAMQHPQTTTNNIASRHGSFNMVASGTPGIATEEPADSIMQRHYEPLEADGPATCLVWFGPATALIYS